jgi:hypothetical protein
MPRPTRANGRPGTKVIPPRWGALHAQAAAGTRTDATVDVRVPGTTPRWNNDRKRTEATDATPFATKVPARILALTASTNTSTQDAADDTVRVIGYRISVPLGKANDARLLPGVLVDVVSCSDPLLVGRTLRVEDVVRGSHRFERDLLCTLND